MVTPSGSGTTGEEHSPISAMPSLDAATPNVTEPSSAQWLRTTPIESSDFINSLWRPPLITPATSTMQPLSTTLTLPAIAANQTTTISEEDVMKAYLSYMSFRDNYIRTMTATMQTTDPTPRSLPASTLPSSTVVTVQPEQGLTNTVPPTTQMVTTISPTQPIPHFPFPYFQSTPGNFVNLALNNNTAPTIIPVDDVDDLTPTPFVKELSNYSIPTTSRLPVLKTYSGTTCPDSHIDTYEWRMRSLKLDKRFWCTYFTTTLDGNAGAWFKIIETISIL